jgi:hypothetical protein
MLKTVFVVTIYCAFFSSPELAAYIVKQSSSGICHPPESGWYERTKNYTPLDSLKACLQAGGRLPKGLSLTSLNGAQNENEKRVVTDPRLATAGTTQTATARTAAQKL